MFLYIFFCFLCHHCPCCFYFFLLQIFICSRRKREFLYNFFHTFFLVLIYFDVWIKHFFRIVNNNVRHFALFYMVLIVFFLIFSCGFIIPFLIFLYNIVLKVFRFFIFGCWNFQYCASISFIYVIYIVFLYIVRKIFMIFWMILNKKNIGITGVNV